ncbi:pre-mRNA-splicing factor 38B isoform X1 [Sitophilus oryzae]|uniref:Pre-mRNA-splicing factor 38 n=2 Tax=Sitophilus oryzae TaxID=7048 RepID=A0A6J2XZ72_SITOR|nr:pre-mRNA-splicing factor 38B isoform X1 [Sitophilus oryzae]
MDPNNSGDEDPTVAKKQSNVLPLYGNERTMNLNPLILTNIQSSHYFKVNLYELKTYHEVVDEIYYKVSHLEPWEKGSRRTSGQTGMCGGVRGVGAGGIVSTAYCLLYKLFTLKLTRKQLNGLITHCDSPYIRSLGFMYIRYVLPPSCLLEWYEDYLEDEEEVDVKAGGGQTMTIGQMLRQWLVKLEWFSTLFPRIPVPIQQKIQKYLESKFPPQAVQAAQQRAREDRRFERERPAREDLRRDFLRDDRDRRDDRRERERHREDNDRRERKHRDRSRSPNKNKHKHHGRDNERERNDKYGREERYRGRDRY